MSEKITLQDIIELLAEKHQMTKKDAEIFVRGMFELIEEALATEKYVKVKGLGTFKLTEVDSRKSIDINTGERFEIQGHTKISFTPDSSMKDLINKPFAHFETVILNENTQLEDTETEVEGEEDEEGKEENPEETITGSLEETLPREEVMTTEAGETEADREEREEKNLVPPETVAVVIEKEMSQAINDTEEEIYPASPLLLEGAEEARAAACRDELDPSEKTGELVEETIETAEKENSFFEREAVELKITEVGVETTEEEKNKETINEPQEEPEKEDRSLEETLIDIEISPVEEAEVVTMMKNESTPSEVDRTVDTFEGKEPDFSQSENTEVLPIQTYDAKKKSGTPWGIIIMAIILTLCIASGIYWYLKTDNEKPVPRVPSAITVAPAQSEKEELVHLSDSLNSMKDSTNILPPDSLPTKVAVSRSQQTASTTASSGSKDIAKVSLADTVEYDITGTKTNYTLQEGESLIKVAVKFYGSKKLWPYIVKHNKDIIKNADRVPIGTTLRIPELVPKKQ